MADDSSEIVKEQSESAWKIAELKQQLDFFKEKKQCSDL